MHPHPGFPTFARLDDVCGACVDTSFSADKDYEVRLRELREAQNRYLTPSTWRGIAAVAAGVVLIATTAALCRRRGS